ncbi:MAG: phytanoyl-CoA dioxygenase family protein [Rhodospirillales bacterium]|nr:phytanoyl-CoA dioxygenase family protein [Rhodospirillales bacterium]
MRQADIEQLPLHVLSAEQRAFYFANGYLLLEGYIDAERVEALRGVLDALYRRAETPADCPPDFEFETSDDGRHLRQILCAADHHDMIWSYASDSPLVDAVADLVGPDVLFRESNVAFKRPGGRGFDWHQDSAFAPATNLTPLMTLTYLDDVTMEMGPTRVIPGSYRGPLLDHYGPDGAWLGLIGDQDRHLIPEETAVAITAPAGSVLISNCNTVHSALPNTSDRGRPVVIAGYQSADTACFAEIPYRSRHRWTIVRGRSAPTIHAEDRVWKMPPDWDRHAGIRIDNLSQQPSGQAD